jgi:PBP1b-binding outer membrane lipoprotein LpoB
MNKPILYMLIISTILISGCVSTVNPVDPSNIIVNVNPIEIKEFQEQEIAVNVINNATAPIDSVSVSSFDTFSIISGGSVNIPARTDTPSSVILNMKVAAPGFKDVTNTTTLTISYSSGIDKNGNPVIKSKSVPVQTVVLPDAKLQFVGFVKGLDNLRDAELNAWEASKGENVTISFSVKNEGKTIIEENTTKVYVEMGTSRMGSNNSLTVANAMAKGGTSNTLGLQIRVPKDAPNGETEVIVTLKLGDKILDSKTLKFIVKL